MKKLLDTVALIAAINPHDKLQRKASQHLENLENSEDTFVPAPILIEFDLELKSHGFTDDERLVVFEDLAPIISPRKVLAQSVIAMAFAVKLQENGMSYFDALLSSMASEAGAAVITTDRAIADKVRTEW